MGKNEGGDVDLQVFRPAIVDYFYFEKAIKQFRVLKLM